MERAAQHDVTPFYSYIAEGIDDSFVVKVTVWIVHLDKRDRSIHTIYRFLRHRQPAVVFRQYARHVCCDEVRLPDSDIFVSPGRRDLWWNRTDVRLDRVV